MGPAHSTITNQHTYNSLYVIEPGETVTVEANPDAIGLKVGIIYHVNEETKEFLYQRFLCKNDSIFNISEIIGEEVSFYGDGISLQAKGKLKENDSVAFDMASYAVHDKKSDAPHKLEKEPRKEGTKSSAAVSDSTKKDMADAAEEKKKKVAAAGALSAGLSMFKGSADSKAIEVVKAEPVVEKKKAAKKDDSTAADGGEVKKKKVVKKKKEGEEGAAAVKKAGTSTGEDGATLKPVPKKKKPIIDETEAKPEVKPEPKHEVKQEKKDSNPVVDEKFGAGLIPDFSGITNSFQALKEKAKEKLDTAKEKIDNAKDFMKEKLTISSTPLKHEDVAVESAASSDANGNNGNDSNSSDVEPPVPAVNYGFSDFQNNNNYNNNNYNNNNNNSDDATTNDDDEADAIAALANRANNKKGGINPTKAQPVTNGKSAPIAIASSNGNSNSNSNNNNSNSSSSTSKNNSNAATVTPNPYEVGILVPQLRRRPVVVEEKPVEEIGDAKTGDANCKCSIM